MNNYWETDKIKIRAFDESDIDRIIENRNNRNSTVDWLHDDIFLPKSPAQLKEELAEFVKEQKDEQCRLVIETRSGTFVGEVWIWMTNRRGRNFMYGIEIATAFQGQGYGKDALKIVFDYYFNELAYNKAISQVYGYNTNSQNFHTKFGFIQEGILREHDFTRGKFWDRYTYGLLAREFNEKYSHNSWKSEV